LLQNEKIITKLKDWVCFGRQALRHCETRGFAAHIKFAFRSNISSIVHGLDCFGGHLKRSRYLKSRNDAVANAFCKD